MEAKKRFNGTITLLVTVIATLLLLVPQALFVRQTYEKYTEDISDNMNDRFSAEAEIVRLNILGFIETKEEIALNAGFTLSFAGTGTKEEERGLSSFCELSEADEILIFAADGSLIRGKAEYGPLFAETAKEALSSGKTAVSQLRQCGDGTVRIGIASGFLDADGSGKAVVLLFNKALLEKTLDISSITDKGKPGITDENGYMILCRGTEDDWFKNNLYSFVESGVMKEKLLAVERTADGEKYTAFMKTLGINGWMVIYMQPSQKLNMDIDRALANVNLFSAVAVVLILGLIAFNVFNAYKASRRMDLFNMKFRIATKQSARAAFEYDRRTDKLIFISESEHVKLPKPYVSLMELGTYVHPADRPTYYQSVSDLRNIGQTSVILRLINFCGRDVYRWYHVTGTRLTEKGEGKALTIGTVEDIDEQENERLILREKATTDGLTGLRNRAETEKTVNEHLLRLAENEHSVFALFDLDGFKDINDKYGHDCGDRALIYFADKLRTTFRFGDIIGRLGGDEFVVYMSLSADKKVVERRLREFMDCLARDSMSCGDGIPPPTCSIGCSLASRGDTFESVYKRADNALYKSKNNGKGQFTFYE
ncbi:MAG: diguanylate cyclase [Oscillospiraceae bacterium]|nr:diguanylate cyclase [Oscillospiraceae bacterium]